MAMADGEARGGAELELLLPWYATGAVSRREAEVVERALSRSPELAHRLAQIQEEREETIRLNESLGAPSIRAHAKLFAAIDADPAPNRRAPKLGALAARVTRRWNG